MLNLSVFGKKTAEFPQLLLEIPCVEWVNGNGSKEMGRIGLLCHGTNLHCFGIGSNGLGSTLKNAKFKEDNILISTQVHSTQFDLSQFDLSYSTKRVDLILFDLFHSTHFMQSRRICSKCRSSFATDQRRIDFHGTQFGCGTSRGAGIAAHVFRNIIENEQDPENVILKMDFKNAFNSLKRDKILDTVFRKRRQIYNYTHSAYSESSLLFFGEKVIQSQVGCQQGDPEGPALFSDPIQDFVNQMVSQYNVWYLDDGNLSDDYRTVLEDLKRIIASADEYGLSLEKTKCYLIFLGNCTESSKKRIKALFDEICPGIKVEDRENLEILGSPMSAGARRDLLNKK